MTKNNLVPAASTEAPDRREDIVESSSSKTIVRRSFLKGMGLAGATFAAAPLLAAASETVQQSGIVTSGDVAILRFLAAAELIEADLWQQYAKLG
jgi:hypothetical protein